MNPNDTVKLGDFIKKIKEELTYEVENPAFFVDEVTLEVSIGISGNAQTGSDLGVFKVGAEVHGETLQKAVIKLTPLLSKEEFLTKMKETYPEFEKQVIQNSPKVLPKGNQDHVGIGKRE